MSDPQAAIISQFLQDYNSFVTGPVPQQSNYQNAARVLLAAFNVAIVDNSHDNFMTLWNFFVDYQNTTLQEGIALYGVTTMPQSDRAIYTLIYTMFRQATNGLQPTTTGDALALLVRAPIVVQFLQEMARTAIVGSEQLSGNLNITNTTTLSPIPPNTLLGNPRTITGIPEPVQVGQGLTLTTDGGLSVSGGNGSGNTSGGRILHGVGDPVTLPPAGGYIYIRTDLANTFASIEPLGPPTVVQTATMTPGPSNIYHISAPPTDGNLLIAIETTTTDAAITWGGWTEAAAVGNQPSAIGCIVMFHRLRENDFTLNGTAIYTNNGSTSGFMLEIAGPAYPAVDLAYIIVQQASPTCEFSHGSTMTTNEFVVISVVNTTGTDTPMLDESWTVVGTVNENSLNATVIATKTLGGIGSSISGSVTLPAAGTVMISYISLYGGPTWVQTTIADQGYAFSD